MSNRKALNENELENVVGGAFVFDSSTSTLTYYHDDGSITQHTILDYNNAWNSSNKWHARNYTEDDILNGLISRGYIA